MAGRKDDGEDEALAAVIVLDLERLSRIVRSAEHDGALNPAQWQALRFLGRANRFSNSPGALARYLGATKGTTSQTVKALERKGYIVKSARAGRSIALALTPKGREELSRDPWLRLKRAAADLGGKTRRRLAKGLDQLLAESLAEARLPSFGQCRECRYHREKGREGDPRGPHLCMLLDEPVSKAEARSICAWAEPA